MAVVNIVRGMQTAAPVGLVNVHPLPALPSGIQRLHLMRRNLVLSSRNLVGFSPTDLVETDDSGTGEIVYGDTYAYGTNRGAGWVDGGWVTAPVMSACRSIRLKLFSPASPIP